MVNLPDKIAAEKENVEKTLQNLQIALHKKDKSPLEVAGMATFLHNIITKELADKLYEYLAFRHYFIHDGSKTP